MASKTKPAARRAVKSAPTKKSAPKAAKTTHLRIGEYSKKEGGVFTGIFPGGKGKPDYYLYAANDKKAAAIKAVWGPSVKVEGADSDTDGMANTKAMAAAGCEISKKALALKIDGHADFYIAAPREARLIAAAAPDAYGERVTRWTSKQYRDWAALAVAQSFDDGSQWGDRKSNSFGVAFVRRVPIR